MIIDCCADLHGHYPELEGGDLLIVAGDLTAHDTESHLRGFEGWLLSQGSAKYKKIVVIAGNHDNSFYELWRSACTPYLSVLPQITYLCDSGTEFEGLRIWGSPWTKSFEGMNPKCKAFTLDSEEELAEKWKLIPDDVDILITHSPPWGYFDHVDCEPVGSQSLLQVILRIRPKLCIFGHIHEGGGGSTQLSYWSDNPIVTKMVNASHVNEHYEPVNKPIRVIL